MASVWRARKFVHTTTSLGLLRAVLSLWRHLFLEGRSEQHVIEGRGVLRRIKIARGLRLLHHAIDRRDLRSRTSKVVRALEAIVTWQCQEAHLWSLGRSCRHMERDRTMETSQHSRQEGVLQCDLEVILGLVGALHSAPPGDARASAAGARLGFVYFAQIQLQARRGLAV